MSRTKVRGIVLALSPAAVAVAAALSFTHAEAQTTPRPATPGASRVARGKYLVTVGGCHDCHTPWKMGAGGIPEPDMTRALSGHPEGMKLPPPPKAVGPWIMMATGTNTAWAGPWGISYAMNLTPDENTGMGIWTEDIFIRAIRTGKHMGTSRPIMPPMPWHNYAQMTDEDLKSVYAYVRSIPAIKNRVPDYEEPKAAPPAVKPAPAKKP